MMALSHKAKQYLLAALKVLILIITFGYIYLKLTDDSALNLSQFSTQISATHSPIGWSLLLFLGLTVINWVMEILKWKTVASVVQPISFGKAARQSLAALTISLATPNRIGEYGAKAYFFPSEKRKQILLLNFFSNLVQMTVTIVFGILGLVLISQEYQVSFSTTNIVLIGLTVLALGILGFIFKEKELVLKGFSLTKIWNYIKKLSSRVKGSVVLLSFLRYLTFSFLFFLILRFFGTDLRFQTAMPLIYAMYLLASLVPTIFIFDVVVRGGVAVWLFSLAGIPELPVLCTVLAMWILNFALPALWGSFYVVSLKLKNP